VPTTGVRDASAKQADIAMGRNGRHRIGSK
jgi:hypothetical protein